MNGLPYYKAYPRDFIEGTIGMPFELKAAYRLVLDLIYMQGGQLPDDARYISGLLGCSVKKWNGLREALISAGKIEARDGYLGNYRADKELETLAKLSDKQRENRSRPNKNKEIKSPPSDHTEPDTDITKDAREDSGRKPVDTGPLQALLERCQAHYPGKGWRRTEPWAQGKALSRALMAGADGERIVAACKAYAAENADAPHKFDNFLNTGLWENYAPAATAPNWRAHVQLFRDHGKWLADGPNPDQPGCLAPAEVLEEFGYLPGKHDLRVVA